MRMRVYAIYDRVAEEGGPIFSAVNDGVAIREFRALIQQCSPVDRDAYKLYLLGVYDTEKVMVFPEDKPVEVIVEVRQLGLYTKEEIAKMAEGIEQNG